jgi:hypothetical protein
MINRERLRRLIPPPLLAARRSFKQAIERRRFRRREPVICAARGCSIAGADHTAVILCGPYFDQRVPNAGMTYRLGLARGFEQIGVPYELVSLFNLARLRELPDPVVFISETDYEFMGGSQMSELRRYRHFVWVNPWFEGADAFYAKHHLEGLSVAEPTRRRVFKTEPAFVFTIATQSGMEFFSEWERRGFKLVSLPLACDTALYDRRSSAAKFDGVKMAFVGGYWPYKARSFDLYLKPYEAELTIYGYSPWPYAGYGGQLAAEDEPLLYRDAILSPAINEPHVSVMNIDINERVYKVLGSGGLCITDAVRAFGDLFGKGELLVPESADEYHDMVRAALGDDRAFGSYREAGYKAVRERHTYAHRAQTALESLGLAAPKPSVLPATA